MKTMEQGGLNPDPNGERLEKVETSISELTTMIKSLKKRKHSTRRKHKHRRRRSSSSSGSESSRGRRSKYSRHSSQSRFGTSATSSKGRSSIGSASDSDSLSTSGTQSRRSILDGNIAQWPPTSGAQNLLPHPVGTSAVFKSSTDPRVNTQDACMRDDNAPLSMEESLEIHIDEETRKLLGAPPKPAEKFGPKFHSEIYQRWGAIRISGMLKDERVKLKEDHPPPQNCELGGPNLNQELLKTLPAYAKEKDEDLRRVQDHIGVSLSIMGQALTNAIQKPDSYSRNDMLQNVSDAGRYLMGTHYFLSSLRRKMIKSNIKDPDMKELLDKCQISSNLFGPDLATQVKTAQALAKTSREISGATAPKDVQKTMTGTSHQPRRTFAPSNSKTKESLNYNRPPTKRTTMSPKRWSGRSPRFQRATKK
ncbi:hypothetical protein Ocin01_19347 [Orchesella cincta]|uniref:Uncharacterized protein n=1 Tax=Orchesella cincta TaxID=48709 RepID=A0A1D2M2Z8_ORCCI|nr:hypothetical protein Ocin01_19347 [Orchesella cincta]